MPSLAGQRLDKYDMLEEVGHGGMAVVYRSRDTVLDREVAVKVLHPHLADREESRARLRREALTVAKLRHDNILEIFDYSGESAHESYIVTEFIHGVTLRDWLDKRWQARPAVAAMIVHRLSLALAHAHEFGVVHRDLKPENVMIRNDGCLKLMDFGIAQILDHQKLTMTGQLLGSPAYMAPELISGKPIDSRTDLFSVGIMLYQLSTGQLPFSGRNPHEVLNRIADADCAPPSSVNPMVDEDLEEILRRALSREPAHRYQTARALANDLEDYLQSMGVEAGPELLHAYFKNPEACVAELDARICAHLLDRAEKAQRDGHAARAIKQLARVLELDPQNARARTLIEQVRRRGRILRQSLMAASLLAGLGLVGAGALLMQEEPSPPGPGEVAAAKDAPPPRRARPAEPPREPDKKTPAVAGSGPVPEVEPGEPEAKGPREKEPRRPREPPRPAGKECRIEVKGIPAAQLRDYSLKLGDQKVTLDPDSSAAALDIPGGGGRFVLSGPRYELARDLSPEQCAGGTLTVQAEPRPATLDLRDVPPELETGEKLTIRCVSGCEFTGFYPELKKFRQKLPPGADNVAVVIALKAVGWTGDETRKLQLEPGPNSPKFWLRKLE